MTANPGQRIQIIQGRMNEILHRFEPARKTEEPLTSTPRAEEASVERRPIRDILHSDSAKEPLRPQRKFSEELEGLINLKSSQHGVHPDLIKAVIQVESGGNQKAVSRAGAIGLMQLMPATARTLGVDPHDPEENVDGGVRFLKDMARQFGNLDHTLAAYNAGPGAVRRYGGIPPFAETQNYVKKIRQILNRS